MEAEVLPACRELGVSLVAYSPLGRGMLTGTIAKDTPLAENDFRRAAPRFQGENLDANLRLVEALRALADEKGCAPGQLALAWLLHQGPEIVPIPGTRRIKYLKRTSALPQFQLTPHDLGRINAAMPAGPPWANAIRRRYGWDQCLRTRASGRGDTYADDEQACRRAQDCAHNGQAGARGGTAAGIAQFAVGDALEPGCTFFTFYAALDDAGSFVLVEDFADSLAFDAHMKQPNTKAFFAKELVAESRAFWMIETQD